MANSQTPHHVNSGSFYHFLADNGLSIKNSLPKFVYLILALTLPMGLFWSLHAFYNDQLNKSYQKEMMELKISNKLLTDELGGARDSLTREILKNEALEIYILKRNINLNEIEKSIISSATNLHNAQSLLDHARGILDSSRNIERFPLEIRHLQNL